MRASSYRLPAQPHIHLRQDEHGTAAVFSHASMAVRRVARDVRGAVVQTINGVEQLLAAIALSPPRPIGMLMRHNGYDVRRNDVFDLLTHAALVGVVGIVGVSLAVGILGIPPPIACAISAGIQLFYHLNAANGCLNP